MEIEKSIADRSATRDVELSNYNSRHHRVRGGEKMWFYKTRWRKARLEEKKKRLDAFQNVGFQFSQQIGDLQSPEASIIPP